MNDIPTEIVDIWDGDFSATIKILLCKSKELHVRQQGQKLILKDTRCGFYSCVPIGGFISIPIYTTEDEDDPIIMVEEPVITEEQKRSISSEQEELMRKWGLL